jgi:hypothetical protein
MASSRAGPECAFNAPLLKKKRTRPSNWTKRELVDGVLYQLKSGSSNSSTSHHQSGHPPRHSPQLTGTKFGKLPDRTLQQINALSLSKLEALGEALLDFAAIDDLQDWLKANKSRRSAQT